MTANQTSGSGGPGSNEAAERLTPAAKALLDWNSKSLPGGFNQANYDYWLDRVQRIEYEARAAERCATVERIREESAKNLVGHEDCKELGGCTVQQGHAYLLAILDEEAPR